MKHMSPESYAKATEHSHQVALFMKASQNLELFPELKWMYAVPNGGERAVAVAGRLKAEGVKSGVSDVCLPAKRGIYGGLYIEMKKPGNLKGETKNQKEFGAFVMTQGYYYRCIDNWVDAWALVMEYLTLDEGQAISD